MIEPTCDTASPDYVSLLINGLVSKLRVEGSKKAMMPRSRITPLKVGDKTVRDVMREIDTERQIFTAARDEACGLITTYVSAILSDLGSERNKLSPISCLPDEVLSLIFEAACTGQNHSQTAPLNIAAVPRAWRDVALCTPRIWTAITIFSASLFLPRSKGALIDIAAHSECSEDMLDYLALCLPHTDRWRPLNPHTQQWSLDDGPVCTDAKATVPRGFTEP
ncbi:hypothetical protein BOTBODRAFT_175186 [Botryobasidium botryosum FD-172 SS1]|uniref:Uncharacterized protein n=1 Tax=Botryobasidium botryosum (strain FD-172 SS1) TaxID=930990 RepID=A0A067MQ76_BOTB1|nr:hypothetical protein BOTBODRAFT_175186 [Botryobasidium botryosum FD-172 SS1]